MATTFLMVPDIICKQCENILTRALEVVPGVASVRVDIPRQRVLVEHDADLAPPPKLMEAVEEEDYFVSQLLSEYGQSSAA